MNYYILLFIHKDEEESLPEKSERLIFDYLFTMRYCKHDYCLFYLNNRINIIFLKNIQSRVK